MRMLDDLDHGGFYNGDVGMATNPEPSGEKREDTSLVILSLVLFILCLSFQPIHRRCGPFILGGRCWNPWSQFFQINVPPRFISFGPLIIFLPRVININFPFIFVTPFWVFLISYVFNRPRGKKLRS